jgi:hypothetical protein
MPREGEVTLLVQRQDTALELVGQSAVVVVPLRDVVQLGDWELGLYSAMERLRRRALADLSILQNWEAFWEEHNRFHAALLDGCQLKRLLVIQNTLERQHSRYYRRLPFSREWAADFIQNHEKLVAVALSGDADAAAAMTRAHAMLTSDTLLATGLSALGPTSKEEAESEPADALEAQ